MISHALLRSRLATEIGRALDHIAKEGPSFRWGRHDCVLWAANILVAAGLPDPVAEIRGRYRSVTGARRLVGKEGFGLRMEKKAADLGWPELQIARNNGVPVYPDAAPGDIGLAEVPVTPLWKVLGCVIRGPHGDWHGPIERGYNCHPDHAVIRAWCVLPEAVR